MLGPRGALLPVLRPADGTGELFVGSDYAWTKVASFTGPPWSKDGRLPVFWQYDHDVRRGRYRLQLVAGPQVQLVRRDTIELLTLLPAELVPEVTVVRAQAADLVPELGTPFRADEIVGLPAELVNGYDPEQVEYTAIEDFLGRFAMAEDIFKAMVVPRANGVSIRHALDHWMIDITVPWDAPAAYAWEIVHPTGFNPFGGAIGILYGGARFHLRLVCTSNVIVDGHTTYTVIDEGLSTLRFELAVVDLDRVPLPGTDLSRGYLLGEVTDLPATMSAQSRSLLGAAEFAIGFVPVVGTAVAAAHVGYMAATGRSVYGDKVPHDQLLLHGMFALLGCLGDTKEAAEVLATVAGRLYPGVKLVSLNPGVAVDVREIVERAVNDYVLEALERARGGDYDRALHTLDDCSAGRSTLAELGTVLDEVVYRGTEVALDGPLPDRLVRESFDWIHPANFDTFDGLPVPRQQTLIDAYESVLTGAKPASYLVDRLEPELHGQFVARLDEWRADRVLNVFRSGFRSASLSAGYARYVSRGGHLNAVQWAVTQIRGVYADALRLAVGGDFRQVLRRADPEQLWKVSPEAAGHFKDLHAVPDFYIDLRDANRGFGLLFEIDHGIEYRFFRRQQDLSEGPIAYDHVRALLVPKNPEVARQLPADQVFYAHSVKTAMLNHLLPHGTEGAYTLQQLLDAYTLVYVHWLGVPFVLYRSLVVDAFLEVAEARGITLDLVIRTEAELMARNPWFRSMP